MREIRSVLLTLLLAFAFLSLPLTARAENSLADDNAAKTLIVEDKDTTYTIIRLKGDSANGALLVSGLGWAQCSTLQFVKHVIPAFTDSGTALVASATSTQAMVTNESIEYLFVNATTTATVSNGMQLLPGESMVLSASTLKNIHVYDGGAAAATASILFCR